MLYILHEDSKDSSTTRFWRFLSNYIADIRNIKVEGLGGNEQLKIFLDNSQNIHKKDYYIHRTKISRGIKINLPITLEYLCAILLGQLANNAFGDFSVGKTQLGSCWCTDCVKDKMKNCNKCKIQGYHKTAEEKARNLWNCTKARSLITDAKNYFKGI